MRYLLRSFLALCLLLAAGAAPVLGQTGYTATLAGGNEVPGNLSTATGTVNATLDGTTLTVTGSFSGLSSPYRASHIHLGLAGQNGGVEVPLNPTVDGDNLGGTFDEQVTLNDDQIAALGDRQLYVNVHTDNYPGGEIRGQMVPEGHEVFRATLSGGSAVPANASAATGQLLGDVNADTGELTVTGAFGGLRDDYTVSHLHTALAGRNGGVAVPLTPTLGEDNRSGTYAAADNQATLSADQLADLRARRIYANIHSNFRPGGEIRGQMVPASSVVQLAVLSGRAQTPPNASQATGGVLVEWMPDGSVVASGGFSNLASDFDPSVAGTGAHLHLGDLGVGGGIEIPLVVQAGDDNRTGRIEVEDNMTAEPTEDQITALLDGRLYANIHTMELPSGEIRGQVLPLTTRVFEAYLAGANEVTPVETAAMGGATLLLTPDSTLTLAGSFAGLESDFAADVGGGSHLHMGPITGNGGVVIPLAVTLEGDNRGGSWAAAGNQYPLTAEQYDALWDGMLYVNVHSADNRGGEVRGQVLPATNVAPNAPEITAPADEAMVTIEGDPATQFVAEWACDACDPNGNAVAYRFELAVDENFGLVLRDSTTTENQLAIDYGTIDAILASALIDIGESATVYHRVIATDGDLQAVSDTFSVTLVRGVIGTDAEDEAELPDRFAVLGNYPNPFNPSTSIRFDLPQAAQVRVEVFDLLGRRVLAVPERALSPGAAQMIAVDATALSSGLYFYRVLADTGTEQLVDTGTMTLLK